MAITFKKIKMVAVTSAAELVTSLMFAVSDPFVLAKQKHVLRKSVRITGFYGNGRHSAYYFVEHC